MIYDINKKVLLKGKRKTYNLTDLESKFLESFKDSNTVLYSELTKNMYGIESDKLEDSLKEIKSKFCKKTKVKFKTRYKIGYVLITNIDFN